MFLWQQSQLSNQEFIFSRLIPKLFHHPIAKTISSLNDYSLNFIYSHSMYRNGVSRRKTELLIKRYMWRWGKLKFYFLIMLITGKAFNWSWLEILIGYMRGCLNNILFPSWPAKFRGWSVVKIFAENYFLSCRPQSGINWD